MGSDNDLPYMMPAVDIMEQFEVPYETRFISAHRTPDEMAKYGKTAVSRGLLVIIAGAGGSAHLPGGITPNTRLPVLGVAIEPTPDPQKAAIGSMIDMPGGSPLATMGKNEKGAKNAALKAIRILALFDQGLAAQYDQYVLNMKNEVTDKDAEVVEIGPRTYLERHPPKQR